MNTRELGKVRKLDSPTSKVEDSLQVLRQMDDLQDILNRLNDTIGILEGRLKPILSYHEEGASAKDVNEKSIMCEHAERLRNNVITAHCINAFLVGLIRDLQI